MDAQALSLREVDEPADAAPPAWYAQRITLEEPESQHRPIVSLDRLRRPTATATAPRRPTSASCTTCWPTVRSGCSASTRCRGRRENLLPYLARLLDVPAAADLSAAARRLLDDIDVPRGIALPFSLQRRFLESSPRIQQAIGKLKMALELDARDVEPLCLELQRLIRSTRMPEALAGEIDSALVSQLAGVRAFVVRSSSNAEDLAGSPPPASTSRSTTSPRPTGSSPASRRSGPPWCPRAASGCASRPGSPSTTATWA